MACSNNNHSESSEPTPHAETNLDQVGHKTKATDTTAKTVENPMAFGVLSHFEAEMRNAEVERREGVLRKLDATVEAWIEAHHGNNGNSPRKGKKKYSGPYVFTFGSFRLSVHLPGSDLDVLCVSPSSLDRSDFFVGLRTMLEEDTSVSGLVAIPEAYVPVMKFKMEGIQIDLLYARLRYAEIPSTFRIADDKNLKDVDEESARSLNAPRVADRILSLVPNKHHFRVLLACVKLWARRRGIYSNVLGFLGGVAWAILVAKVCQDNPDKDPTALFVQFFEVYSFWPWPKPLQLEDARPSRKLPKNKRQWDPTIYPEDRSHLMPVITPVFPRMNAAYNVCVSTKKGIQIELERAAQILKHFSLGESEPDLMEAASKSQPAASPTPLHDNDSLNRLMKVFEPTDFFCKFQQYVRVDVIAGHEVDHKRWFGWVESRLRFLVYWLEQIPSLEILPCHYSFTLLQPMTEGGACDSSTKQRRLCSSSFFIGVSCSPPLPYAKATSTVDLYPVFTAFIARVYEWSQRKDCMALHIDIVSRQEIATYQFRDDSDWNDTNAQRTFHLPSVTQVGRTKERKKGSAEVKKD